MGELDEEEVREREGAVLLRLRELERSGARGGSRGDGGLERRRRGMGEGCGWGTGGVDSPELMVGLEGKG